MSDRTVVPFPARRIPDRAEWEHRWVLQARLMIERVATRLHRQYPAKTELAELVSIGMLTAAEQARRYDPARGTPFDAFVHPSVFGAMMNHVIGQLEIEETRRELLRDVALGIVKALDDLAGAKDLDAEGFHDALGVAAWLAVTCADPEEAIIRRDMHQKLAAARAGLTQEDQRILTMHWNEELPLEEVGKALGYGRTTIMARHRGALARLRARLSPDPWPSFQE